MAYGDMGIFTPAESVYTTPGAFTQALRAEATKRAAYLSSMDQFYEQLEESQRQFDKTLAFKESSFEKTLALQRKQFKLQEKSVGIDREGNILDYLARKEQARAASRSGGSRIHLGYSSPQRTMERMMQRSNGGSSRGYSYTPGTGKGGSAGFAYTNDSEYDSGGAGEWDTGEDYEY